jgi:hypothetical protein
MPSPASGQDVKSSLHGRTWFRPVSSRVRPNSVPSRMVEGNALGAGTSATKNVGTYAFAALNWANLGEFWAKLQPTMDGYGQGGRKKNRRTNG